MNTAMIVLGVISVAFLAVTCARLILRGGIGYLRWVGKVRRTCQWEGCSETNEEPGDDFCSDEHAQLEHERLRWDLYP